MRNILKPWNKKGQFSIIAALLVSIVLVTALITTFSIIRNNPIQRRPQILGATEEMNLALEHILEFAIGYYGSILQITGNTTYAKNLVTTYLHNNLQGIVYTHPDWSPILEVENSELSISWFNRTSYSEGSLDLIYSLASLGINGTHYTTSASLIVTVNPSSSNSVLVNVTKDTNHPYHNLDNDNFFFYEFNYTESTWELDNAGMTINYVTSSDTYSAYNITLPAEIDTSAYILQVIDHRGISVTASTFSHYTYSLNWNQSLYQSLTEDTIIVEALQNGTLRWLGQNIELTTDGRPIPPIFTKAFHINQTINGINREVPFQIEDWGSFYRVPLGLNSNASIFGNRQMFVFLVNHDVENVTLWWDGRDIANQTSYAFTNRYFTGDDPSSRTLSNGILTLTISSSGFTITSSLEGSSVTSTSSFLRINDENPVYGASPAYVIHHGIIRDILHQEAEYSGGISECPNVYAQIVLTLPANATFYTYALRTIFVDSVQSRTISDLRALSLSVSTGTQLTENGTLSNYPITSTATGLFYNYTFETGWAHHWSEFKSGAQGAGIMFTDEANQKLYVFDEILSDKTGGIRIQSFGRRIELKPVSQTPVSFQNALDTTWHGAVVSFDDTDPIYPGSGNIGLWVIVESPPSVSVSNS